jgi:hypothetical protein
MNITFRNILKVLRLFNETDNNRILKATNILGIPENIIILDKVLKYIFEIQSGNGEKTFDFESDFRYYYVDFIKLGIDLNKEDISWWQFMSILQGLFLTEDSVISKVISYRTYKKQSPKTAENEREKHYREMKQRFALIDTNKNNKNLEKLYNYLEKKV